MSMLIAKKANLDVMRECQGTNCTCFTDKGYYIQYCNKNVDSMLFVCENCYYRQYKAKCTLGSFDEDIYQRTICKQRYHKLNPVLRKILNGTRKAIHCLRITCIILSILFIALYSIKEKPKIRNEYPSYEVHCEINSNFHGTDNISKKIQNIVYRFTNIKIHE